MRLIQTIENDAFTVEQCLAHYDIGEKLQVYNLKAIASKKQGGHSEIVKNIYGFCFVDELHEIQWFSNFHSRAKDIFVVKKTFQKAYSKMHISFPSFKEVLQQHTISAENMFKTLSANDGYVEDFIILECNIDHEICRFYKEHCHFADKWIPHVEPFNHKKRMITNKEYDLGELYKFLLNRRDVVIPNGIEAVHDAFEDEIIYVLNFYVRVDNICELHEEIFEDLPKEVIDISQFKLKK